MTPGHRGSQNNNKQSALLIRRYSSTRRLRTRPLLLRGVYWTALSQPGLLYFPYLLPSLNMPAPSSNIITVAKPVADCARALASDPALLVTADEHSLAAQLGMVLLPPHNSDSAQANVRGISDSIAVVAAHHNAETHNLYTPYSPLAKSLFNEMERLRCESMGAINKAGVERNIMSLWETSLRGLPNDAEQLTAAFAYLTKKALGQKIKVSRPLSEVLSIWQEPLLSSTKELWPLLKNHRNNQAEFAKVSLDIIATINEDTSNRYTETAALDIDHDDRKESDQQPDDTHESEDDSSLASMDMRDDNEDSEEIVLQSDSDENYDVDNTRNRDAPVDADSESNAASTELTPALYQSYNTTFDEIIHATKLYDQTEREELRETLDEHIERHAKIVGKLSGQLQRLLMANQNRHWKFDLEEGLLDAARLTRIITQPYSGLSFKQESDIEFRDTVVTLLVDNSKSMLGKPIAIAASCADILAQTLERCGISVEILGFTTTELHGGPLFNLWKEQGKSQEPGRLNGLRHIIYKSADVPYRRARSGFGLMLHKDLLKQNIDGEALLWANERLQKRPEERKILLVISDGAPIDTSTMSANKENYLVDHLHHVIQQLERQQNLELAAIGIGHDVTTYYQRAITIRDAKDLGKTLLTQFRSLFSKQMTPRG